MRRFCRAAWVTAMALTAGSALVEGAPADLILQLDAANPHYFRFRGRPSVLISSGEHYGAVLNLDFDFKHYLAELHSNGLNLTRTFSGAYVEPVGAFHIAQNTLAPAANRFICPWGRSSTPGYPNGGNKFDLGKWDEAYFRRLRAFATAAQQAGVVVELNLFCPFYEEGQWNLSPQNARNNINQVGDVARTNVYTLDRNGGLLRVQEEMVRKMVSELNRFENVYYEICNEPYFGGVTLEWQRHIADVITKTEKSMPRRHLISQNISNGKAKVENPDPAVSIFNFHYATPPEAVALNYGLGKVIGDNETGFRGTNNLPYRKEAWEFILAGGGLFNHLDYSFTAGHESGDFVYPAGQPGGGNRVFRHELKVLHDFMGRFDFDRMHPEPDLLAGGLPKDRTFYALGGEGRGYAIYIGPGKLSKSGTWEGGSEAGGELELRLAKGQYRGEWIDPRTGKVAGKEAFEHLGGTKKLALPVMDEDLALALKVKR